MKSIKKTRSEKKSLEREEKKSKNKHVPSEKSAKERTLFLYKIPNLKCQKSSNLYSDIRFNRAYGKANYTETRRNYLFLDEYRRKEIEEIKQKLREDKKMGNDERDLYEKQLLQLTSRMRLLNERDQKQKILTDFLNKQNQRIKEGKQMRRYFLKEKEKKKLIDEQRFLKLNSKERRKLIQKKNKKTSNREMKALPAKSRN